VSLAPDALCVLRGSALDAAAAAGQRPVS
jgi:hypothetical protein